jgi:hypothetical protein
MYDFLPNTAITGDLSYYTACYLTLAAPKNNTVESVGSGGTVAQGPCLQENCHTAFRLTVDPTMTGISEKQRPRFLKAMKRLMVKPRYHLSELEQHIVHPIKDDSLADLCSCRDYDCPGECPDIHSWDRPSCLERVLEHKSEGWFLVTACQSTRLTKRCRTGEGIMAKTYDHRCFGHCIAILIEQ